MVSNETFEERKEEAYKKALKYLREKSKENLSKEDRIKLSEVFSMALYEDVFKELSKK